AIWMLGHDDPDILGRSCQHIVQVLELCTVIHLPVERKFVGDLQRKKAKPIKAVAKVVRLKRIKRVEGSSHLRTKCRYEPPPIRCYGIRQISTPYPPDRRSFVRADVIEIHTERIRISPKLTSLNVQSERGGP